MHIANTLKCNLNSQHKMDALWLVTKIKARLKMPIQKFENPILFFRRTHEASVRNIKITATFKGDLGAAIVSQKESPVNYVSKFCDTGGHSTTFLISLRQD